MKKSCETVDVRSRETVRSETSMHHLLNSAWIRKAPHKGSLRPSGRRPSEWLHSYWAGPGRPRRSPPPTSSEPWPMPADDGVRVHHDQGRPPIPPRGGEQGPNR